MGYNVNLKQNIPKFSLENQTTMLPDTKAQCFTYSQSDCEKTFKITITYRLITATLNLFLSESRRDEFVFNCVPYLK